MQPKIFVSKNEIKKDLEAGLLMLYKPGLSNVSRIWFLFMVAYTKHVSGSIWSWFGQDPSAVSEASGQGVRPCTPVFPEGATLSGWLCFLYLLRK